MLSPENLIGKSTKLTIILLAVPTCRTSMKSTGWSVKQNSNDYPYSSGIYKSTQLADHYQLQEIPYGHCMKVWECATPLQLGKDNRFREASQSDVDERDVSTQCEMDVYDRWLPMATLDGGCKSPHRCQVMRRSSSAQLIPTKTHREIWTTWLVGCWPSLGVEIRMKWCLNLGCREHGSIKYSNSGTQECNQFGVSFFFLISSLLLSRI